MKTNDFDYHLPEKLIAQHPLEQRSHARLLTVGRDHFNLDHYHFYDLPSLLKPGDVLVLNNTKVLPARLIGTKLNTLATIEILLLKQLTDGVWETLTKPAKRIHVGDFVRFGDGRLVAECIAIHEEGIRHFRFHYQGIFYEILDQLGEMPLPPYIHEKLQDRDRYQTVYSKELGSAAAPTAGLHFTPELLSTLQNQGVQIETLTLHVGLGTFRPVQVDDVQKHKMHEEYYQLDEETANRLNQAKQEQRPIIAVGTTSIRTLETIYHEHNQFKGSHGWTNIFIYPGFTFKAVDGLITNFHLPKSTLMMLVSAFSTKDIVMHAYQEAIHQRYRFFSFGDSMFFQPKRAN